VETADRRNTHVAKNIPEDRYSVDEIWTAKKTRQSDGRVSRIADRDNTLRDRLLDRLRSLVVKWGVFPLVFIFIPATMLTRVLKLPDRRNFG
jgi:hypothetical protein